MSKAKQALRDQDFRYKKGLGQNFIFDEGLLEQLVEKTEITKEDDVLEIGPGSGTMTAMLSEKAGRVIALEIDEKLLPVLKVTLGGRDNVKVVLGDVLKTNLSELCTDFAGGFHIVTNLPYYITTPLMTMLLSSNLRIKSICAMVQAEVADKLVARPKDDGYCPLSILAQLKSEVSIALNVPAECFTPKPKVDSSFVRLKMRETPLYPDTDEKIYMRVVKAAFLARRKTLLNSLRGGFTAERGELIEWLREAGIDEMIRGEQLTLDDFARLSKVIENKYVKK
ncbi:MAG: 16S rRNA (adenine(1518)-N(6)/adenine(1519)-N(6))-dimethyltransferase RsmA [Eubacteriales bacterium]|nr:16S rRNA (adenine(1518)-N(6)/adenine(1519)-N(6))-dimethyltransferase RsmA [Eubacteriales bacterium]